MKACPEQIVHYMHVYLDGEIGVEEERVLKEHLQTCSSCREIMSDLEAAIIFLSHAEPIEAPVGFVDGVMSRLPKEQKRLTVPKWFRRYPLVTAAALFLILMSASLSSHFNDDAHFSVTKQENLVIEGETAYVPEGQTVTGDIVVRNGTIHIDGEVEGNVTVINGSKYMASTAIVTGQVDEIDQAFDWLWFKIKESVKQIVPKKPAKEEAE